MGIPRGSVDRRLFNTPGEPLMPPRRGLEAAEKAALRSAPAQFGFDERRCVDAAIRRAAERKPLDIARVERANRACPRSGGGRLAA